MSAAILAISACAVALAAGQADAQSAIQITMTPRHATFGATVTITGNASVGEAGRALQLQFAPAGGTTWRALRSTTVHANGRYRFTASARHSGLLRVVPAGTASGPRAAALANGSQAAAGTPSVSASPAQAISVAAKFAVPRRTISILAGQRGHLRGRLLPAVAGRRVRLLTHGRNGWRTLTKARTGPRGGFDLPVPDAGAGRWLRVGFSGDRTNGPAQAKVGHVAVFTSSAASWYNDGSATACGFHAGMGVANKSLPCGTKVTFRYGGRSVTAVVDDRGPYVGGRVWDLNQNTAGALGYSGIDNVWSSV